MLQCSGSPDHSYFVVFWENFSVFPYQSRCHFWIHRRLQWSQVICIYSHLEIGSIWCSIGSFSSPCIFLFQFLPWSWIYLYTWFYLQVVLMLWFVHFLRSCIITSKLIWRNWMYRFTISCILLKMFSSIPSRAAFGVVFIALVMLRQVSFAACSTQPPLFSGNLFPHY